MKQKILDLLRRHAPADVAVTENSRLREDLDLNSLSMMIIIWETEQILGKTPDISALGAVKTVGDLLRVLEIGEE